MSIINPRPEFKNFRLVNASFENRITEAAETRLSLVFTPTTNFFLGLTENVSEHSNVLVTITIDGEAKLDGENGAAIANFRAIYEGRFEYPKDTTHSDIKSSVEDENYRSALVSQVFPLSITSFKQTLADMGFKDLSLPLSFPPQ